MTEKPSYEELEQRIQTLEKKAAEFKKEGGGLKQTQMELEALFNNAPMVMFIVDRDRRLRRLNEAAVVMTRRTQNKSIGLRGGEALRCVNALGDPRGCGYSDACESCVVRNAVLDTFRTGQDYRSVEGQIPYTAESGTEVLHVLVSTTLLKSPDRESVLVCLIDTTSIKQAESALVKSEKRYRSIFENIQDVYAEVTADGIIIEVSPSITRFGGYTREEVIGRPFADFFADPAELKALWDRLRRQDRINDYEVRLRHKDGSDRICSFTVKTITNASGLIEKIVGTMRDITDRKQAEKALQESEAKLKSVFENKGTATGIYGEDSIIRECNAVFEELSGYSRSEIIGKKKWSDFVVKEDLERMQQYHVQRSKDVASPPSQYECRIISKKGEIRNVIVNIGLVDKIRIVSLTDITAWKQTENEREKLQAQLIQSQKMESIGTLAGGIAHNFNNVLMGILGRASLMMINKDPSHPDMELLKGIEDYVQNAVGLTKDLLGFARGGKYEVKPTNLNTLIRQENRMFGRTRKEIKIHEIYEDNLWAVEVDRGQIRQALLNLYVNSWHAMPGGGNLYVQTENAAINEEYSRPFEINPGKYVKISVTDTGIGMDKETQQRVFDPFFSTKDKDQGSGLGMASTYGIVKNHSGFINVYSERGEGTTCEIYLPVSEKEVTEKDPKPEQQKVQYGQGTVLLVDDEDAVIDVGLEMLAKLGYRALIARSGQEALGIYRKQRDEIDLVILDMIMPGMGGGEVYNRLKVIDKGVQVLLSSGYSINGQAKEIINRGCNGFIQKPFSLSELSIKIKEVLDGP